MSVGWSLPAVHPHTEGEILVDAIEKLRSERIIPTRRGYTIYETFRLFLQPGHPHTKGKYSADVLGHVGSSPYVGEIRRNQPLF